MFGKPGNDQIWLNVAYQVTDRDELANEDTGSMILTLALTQVSGLNTTATLPTLDRGVLECRGKGALLKWWPHQRTSRIHSVSSLVSAKRCCASACSYVVVWEPLMQHKCPLVGTETEGERKNSVSCRTAFGTMF